MPMEAFCGSHSSKKQILLEKEGIDRLSNLPDCVLLCVLSLLKTKDAVRTSVLSRRWKYLWACVADINLEYGISYMIKDTEQGINLRKCFLEFMDRLFILHNTSNIRELRLNCFVDVDNFRLNRWICAAMKHNIQYLDLKFLVEGRPILPLCLYDHQSFVLLKLDLECILKVPIGTHFPYLKKLYLSEIRFIDEMSVEHLFSSCPVLDELGLATCEWNIQNVTTSIPSLRTLTIKGDNISDSPVKIVATNLACLTISSLLDTMIFEFSGFSSLEEASIYLPCDEGLEDEMEEEIATRMLRFFSQINNVKNMTLWGVTVETLIHVEDTLGHLPTFNNLTRLTLDLELNVHCAEFLLEFLDKIPMLAYLQLSDGCDKTESPEDSDDLQDVIMQKRVATCFNSSLKIFAIEGFGAGLLEILMIEYVLRNATILESLFVSCWESRDTCESLSKAKERLLNVPKGSGSCNIVFSFS